MASDILSNQFFPYDESHKRVPLPLFTSAIEAGFPSPADDYMEKKLDMNELCINHPAATFFAITTGTSMTGAGIFAGDVLVIDRAVEPSDKDVVVALLNLDYTVKRFRKLPDGRVVLQPENPAFRPILIDERVEFEVWGVVIAITRVFGKSPLLSKVTRYVK